MRICSQSLFTKIDTFYVMSKKDKIVLKISHKKIPYLF
jgi:hypothetical protein